MKLHLMNIRTLIFDLDFFLPIRLFDLLLRFLFLQPLSIFLVLPINFSLSGYDLIFVEGPCKLTPLLVFFVFLKQLERFDPPLLLSEGLRQSNGWQDPVISLGNGLLGVGFFLFNVLWGENTLLNLPKEPFEVIIRGIFLWGIMNQEFQPGG
jgi:hypothetical protein